VNSSFRAAEYRRIRSTVRKRSERPLQLYGSLPITPPKPSAKCGDVRRFAGTN
jgi:hypothetical protein